MFDCETTAVGCNDSAIG